MQIALQNQVDHTHKFNKKDKHILNVCTFTLQMGQVGRYSTIHMRV